MNDIVLYAASLAVGIWFGRIALPGMLLAAAVVTSLLLAICHVRRNSPRYMWFLALGFFFTGIIRFVHADTLPATDISRHITKQVTVHAMIVDTPKVIRVDENNLQVSYRLQAAMVKSESGPEKATGNLFASIRQEAQEPVFPYGTNIVLKGTLHKLHSYNNPGSIDMVAAWKREGITARLAPEGKPQYAGSGAFGWQSLLHNVREKMIESMRRVMAENDAAILRGTIFGGYNGIPQDVVRDFATTGIVHILSVSGTHIALVAGFVYWLGGLFGLSRNTTASFAAFSIIVYSFMAGLTPPVVRSAFMGLITLLATLSGRETDSRHALILTGMGMLLYQPALLYDISFQLSFGATAGLVFLYPKTLEALSFLPKLIARPVAVTLAAQLGVVPALAWYFSSLSLSSLIANLLVVPIIEWTVILGLTGSIVSFAVPFLGRILLILASLFISGARYLTFVLAAVPGGQAYLPSLGFLGSTLYYSLLIWLFGYTPSFIPRPGRLLERHPCRTAGAVAAILAVAAGMLLVPRPVSIHFIDVGQGDATLVITPRGRSILIDTGGSAGSAGGFDIGERVVVPYLRHQGITSLDYLILTHGHQDHAGGAAAVAALLPVKQVMLPREERSQAVDALTRRLTASVIIPAYRGQTIELDGVEFSLLHAAGDTPVQASGGLNESSSVIRFVYGAHSVLVTGDLENRGEAVMIKQGILPNTILKVGHHGSKTSSSEEFLARVSPQYAVISVGRNNRYGHPHPETLRRLQEHAAVIYRTDQQGAVICETDGVKLTINPFLK